MASEIFILLLASALGLLQLAIATMVSTAIRGTKWNFSSRDQVMPPLTGMPGRIDRSFANFKETFPFFVAAVAAVLLANHTGPFSYYGSLLYLVCRLIYVPLYVFDVRVVRTFVWLGSMIGIVLVFLQLFLP